TTSRPSPSGRIAPLWARIREPDAAPPSVASSASPRARGHLTQRNIAPERARHPRRLAPRVIPRVRQVRRLPAPILPCYPLALSPKGVLTLQGHRAESQ